MSKIKYCSFCKTAEADRTVGSELSCANCESARSYEPQEWFIPDWAVYEETHYALKQRESDADIHVIEYSAYEALKQELAAKDAEHAEYALKYFALKISVRELVSALEAIEKRNVPDFDRGGQGIDPNSSLGLSIHATLTLETFRAKHPEFGDEK